jgi:predicted nuclease of predicted toxin-antitoxin system
VRWLADECVAGPVVDRLREAGHDVTYLAELAPATSDTEAIALAHREDRFLLTEDKDFGELVFRWKRPVSGLVLLRIDPGKNLLKWTRLKTVIETFGDGIRGRYSVWMRLEFDRVRCSTNSRNPWWRWLIRKVL